jgi:5-methylcytosine-specific restriction endonuclease McrA
MVKYYEGAVNAGDIVSNRKFRHRIINEIIEPFLIKRDDKRHFTEFEKQFLWHSNKDKTCGICSNKINDWSDYQIDHKIPWDLGGDTNLSNAQIAHSSCNKSKGNRI